MASSLLSSEGVAEGQRVWIKNKSSDPREPPFLAGTVVEADGTTAKIALDNWGSGETVAVSESELDVANAVSAELSGGEERAEPDNCDLLQLSEATLLHNTLLRYRRDEIYTFTGPIVTSLNPCKPIDGLYSTERMKAAKPREEDELGAPNPHIYSVGANAYKTLCETGRNQSIVVTGISGAGKTEANKYLLKYLVWRASKEGTESSPMAQTVLDSTPVFEAFGNATTVMNPNSSRFGKFMRVLFDDAGCISGANISTYLLEKSRLALQQPGETNFHIFYQLLAGLDDGALAKLHLGRDSASFHYLTRAGSGVREGLDDVNEFKATHSSMQTLGLRPDDVFSILAGILNLGNVTFEVVDENNAERASKVSNPDVIAKAEALLGMTGLSRVLTVRRVQAGARASVYEKPLNPEQAGRARDALSKRVYDRLFSWIVKSINECVAPPGAAPPTDGSRVAGKWIGLLDIFGFEIFSSNSLEQLLINLANEKLQRFFLDSVFNYEQAHYEAEQIEWTAVEVPDNGPIVAAIEDLPNGVLPLLDEQCWLGDRGKDSTFCTLLNQKNPICSAEFAKLDQKGRARFDPSNNFTLAHFVAPVTYTAQEFIEKNRDSIFEEMAHALVDSTNPLLPELFPASELDATEVRAAKGSGKSYGSVASKFGSSLTDLLAELASTDPGFVRTIKPNVGLKPGAPDERLILEQLRTCGMLQCVKMIRSMFPTRILYTDVVARYASCVASYSFMAEREPRDFTAAICESFDVDPEEYRLGLTKLFIKGGCAVALNKLLRGATTRAEQLLQEALLRWKLKLWHKERFVVEKLMAWASRARARLGKPTILPTTHHILAYRALRRAYVDELWRQRAAAKVQALIKARKQRERNLLERKAAVVLGAAMRCTLAQRELARRKANYDAATKIQACARAAAQRDRYKQLLHKRDSAATMMQASARACAARGRYNRLRAAITLQAAARALAARTLYNKLRAAVSLQAYARMRACRTGHLEWKEARARWMVIAANARKREALRQFSATRVQAAARMRLARLKLLAFKEAPLRALIRMQALARGKPPQRALRMALLAVRVLQSIWRMKRIQIIRRKLLEAARVLQKGAVMLKYKKKGGFLGTNHEPHRRFVWLSGDMRNLCWCKPSEQGEPAKAAKPTFMSKTNKVIANKTVILAHVGAIGIGAQTTVLKKMDNPGIMQKLVEKRKDGTIDENAFSIIVPGIWDADTQKILPERRLDLYAESKSEREAWAKALKVVLDHGHVFDTSYLIAYQRQQEEKERGSLAGKSGSDSSTSDLSTTVKTLAFAEGQLAKAQSSDIDELRKLSARTNKGGSTASLGRVPEGSPEVPGAPPKESAISAINARVGSFMVRGKKPTAPGA